MKKLMMVAAVALLAGMSQAASVTWGNTSSSKLYGLDGTTAITAANATAWNLTLTLMNADGTSTGSSISAINSMTAGVTSTAKWTYTYGTDASNGDAFYILCSMTVDGKDYQMKIDNAGSNWAIAATDNTGTDSFTWAAGTYGGLGVEGDTGKWVAQSVPEPTSGLLLLLGMAGLALKRKRA